MFRSFTFRSRQRTDYVGRRSPTPTRPSHHKHSVRVGARYTSLEERAHTKENECRGALNAFHVQICLSVSQAGSFAQSEDAGDLQRICPASQPDRQTRKIANQLIKVIVAQMMMINWHLCSFGRDHSLGP